MKKIKKKNIAIIGLGNIGSYLYNYLSHNKEDLFKKLYHRRILIRLIGIKFSHLVHGNYQIDLFEDSLAMISLYKAMDKVNKRYGHGAIKRAGSLNISNRDFTTPKKKYNA